MAGLSPLDDPEHPDPGLSLHGLTGECCGSGVFPCHRGSSRPVHLDHIVGECVIVDFVGHDYHLLECLAQRREKGGRGRRLLLSYTLGLCCPNTG